MRRRQLFELEDQPWCPALLRDCLTDFLAFAIARGAPYAPLAPRLRAAAQASRARTIIDLGSGAGGPWRALSGPVLGPDLSLVLSDAFPNHAALERLARDAGGRISHERASVDATAVPPHLAGFRTLFTSFHHFEPTRARAVLDDAVRARAGIAVCEATERSAACLLAMLLVPLIVLGVTPWIRPFRWSRLVFTYLVPLVPLMVGFDGLVSCLRSYRASELAALAYAAAPTGYAWEAGTLRAPGCPVRTTYLIGVPMGTPAAG